MTVSLYSQLSSLDVIHGRRSCKTIQIIKLNPPPEGGFFYAGSAGKARAS